MRIKTFFQNIILLSFAIVFALVILELALRIISYDDTSRIERAQKSLKRDNEFTFYEYDRVLGWKNRPLSEGYFEMPDSRTYVKISSKGLRDKEYPYKKEPGTFRILVLGDSFAWGYGVEQDEIFSERLENMLGQDYEVLNAGITGYGTDQELLFFEKEGFKYDPDIVLVAFASNDFMSDNRTKQLGYYPKPFFIMENDKLKLTNIPLPELKGDKWKALEEKRSSDLRRQSTLPDSDRKSLKKFLKKHTRTYPFISRLIKNLKYSFLRKVKSYPTTSKLLNKLRSTSECGTKELNTTKAMFLRMKKRTDLMGSKLVVFIIPYKCALEKLPNPFIDEFIRFFKANNIPCIYPYRSYLDRFQKNEKLYLDYDDHWNRNGHALAAEEIHLFLKKERLLNK